MNENVNIAELLKDCPDGMELDCTMLDNIVFERVDVTPSNYPIVIRNIKNNKTNKTIHLTKYGQFVAEEGYKCVIFPKGKTTWEGFVPPSDFKDGDVIYVKTNIFEWVSIFKKESGNVMVTYADYAIDRHKLYNIYEYERFLCHDYVIREKRLATEEEKAELFNAIKHIGYNWNPETKTMEKMTASHTPEKLYIRIGDIPSDEKSAVHKGDSVVGYEDGVSVYDCVETDGLYRIVMPFPLKEGQGMTYECLIQEITQCRYEIKKPRNVYLVSGTEVGKGRDNEPLIKDVKILKDLTAQFNTKPGNTEETADNTFKDGDIVFSGVSLISILKEFTPNKSIHSYVSTNELGALYIDEKMWTSMNLRHATEEEKERLFKAIKDNGYKWNEKIKTLERVIVPKFKVGDKIRHKRTNKNDVYEISKVYDDSYGLVGFTWMIYMKYQDDYELVPKKFDITTLKPFDKVLVRNTNKGHWRGQFYLTYDKNEDYPFECSYNCWMQCIPYEGNEHLLGTANDCDDFYKNWND